MYVGYGGQAFRLRVTPPGLIVSPRRSASATTECGVGRCRGWSCQFPPAVDCVGREPVGQSSSIVPQVMPPPNPASRTLPPPLKRPCRTTSSRVMGIDAAPVLPNLSAVTAS